MNKTDCKDCLRLENRNAKLVSKNKELFFEMAERGKELEKLRKITEGNRDLFPDLVYIKLTGVLDGYVERCTM